MKFDMLFITFIIDKFSFVIKASRFAKKLLYYMKKTIHISLGIITLRYEAGFLVINALPTCRLYISDRWL